MPDRPDDLVGTTPYDNGVVKHRGATVDGAMHGPWEWYRRDGSLMRTGSFEHGRRVGVWRTHDRAGRVVKETDFGSIDHGQLTPASVEHGIMDVRLKATMDGR